MFKGVLFDLDNTLLDRTKTFGRFADLFVGVFFKNEHSAEWIPDRMKVLDEDGYKNRSDFLDELIEELPWRVRPEKSVLLEFYRTEYVKNAVFAHRAKEVLIYIRNKYKLGLITNGSILTQYGKIDRLGIREMFDVIIVSEEAGVKKPDPKIFEMALARLSLRPEECVYIGDHPANDIVGAANAGLQAVWIKANHPWKEELATKPLYSLSRLDELLELL